MTLHPVGYLRTAKKPRRKRTVIHWGVPRDCLRLFVTCLLLIGALSLAGCGMATPTIQPFTYAAVPWSDGEVSIYRITDVNGDYAGTARYDVSAGGRNVGSEDWTIRREIVAQGDDEIVAVEVTNAGLRPSAAMLVRTKKNGSERVETTYDGGQIDMKLTTIHDVTTPQHASIPSDARDQRTVLFLTRLLPLDDRYAVRFDSYLPIANQLERVTLQVVGREQVTVPAGTFDTWHVVLDTTAHKTEAWIGIESPAMLVKYHDGRSGGTFELSEYEAGNVE